MHSTRTRVHARIPNGYPREEKRACRTKVRRQVVRACPARGELNGPRALVGLPRAPRQAAPTSACAGHADFRARILGAEVGEEVRVGVGVHVGPVEFKLKYTFNQLIS